MRRFKVFYFLPNLQQGGTERQVLELIRGLPKHFEPVLCLYHDDVFFRRELPENQPRYVLGVDRMNLRAYAKLFRILQHEKPDIFHSFRDKSNFWGRIAALRAQVPVVLSSCRNRAMELRYLLVERALAKRCQLVLTNSVGVRDELTQLARVPRDKVRVIHNHIDTEFFCPPSPAQRRAARQEWGLAPGQKVMLLPGRIGLQKHQIGLLLALRDLVRQGRLADDWLLLLAGRRRDAQLARAVDALASCPEFAGRVRLLGAQQDTRSLYWAADLLVMPSLYEGLANAALEGAACGLPAVLSHAGNLDQIIVSGEGGLEVPTGYRAALADAIAVLLARDENELRSMGRAARAQLLRRFAPQPDRAHRQVAAIYNELLEQAGMAWR